MKDDRLNLTAAIKLYRSDCHIECDECPLNKNIVNIDNILAEGTEEDFSLCQLMDLINGNLNLTK
jgi:hypothetical protein